MEANELPEGADDIVRAARLAEPVYVTRPTLPPLADYHALLERIWENKWLTNNGVFHNEFEAQLAAYLGIEHVNVFCNGTIALLVALHALRITGGEVITTPFTFPATPHVLYWNGITPVFCDIDEKTFNLDPGRIEQRIGPHTKAILPVHVYGTPCDVEAIQNIADRHGLAVIYDAAHAFGVRYKGRALATYGDISMLSFHATKLFSTLEGGALAVKSGARRKRINSLKNFGIADEETVIGPGINGKMNEFQAAYGLLQFGLVENEIANRAARVQLYRAHLQDIPGISFLEDQPQVRHNYAYFPIVINPEQYGMARNTVHAALKKCNIYTRKYFYPLCSTYPCYASLPSAGRENLPVAHRVAEQVLCLPLYGALEMEVIPTIGTILKKLAAVARNNARR